MTKAKQFWNVDNFDLQDRLNATIFTDYPKSLGLRDDGTAFGNIHEFTNPAGTRIRLPWLPDLVGKDWGKHPSVLVVGSAYAPFIEPHATRKARLGFDAVHKVIGSLSDFQELFLRDLVQVDTRYYGRIASLLQGIISPRQVVISDLTRSVFVARVGGRYSSSQGFYRYKAWREAFGGNVEACRDWTWERIRKANIIIALGWIAEHGLLSLLTEKGYQAQPSHRTEGGFPFRILPVHHGEFACRRAWVSLGYWLSERAWWEMFPKSMDRQDAAQPRKHIIPVYHPARLSAKRIRSYQALLTDLLTSEHAWPQRRVC